MWWENCGSCGLCATLADEWDGPDVDSLPQRLSAMEAACDAVPDRTRNHEEIAAIVRPLKKLAVRWELQGVLEHIQHLHASAYRISGRMHDTKTEAKGVRKVCDTREQWMQSEEGRLCCIFSFVGSPLIFAHFQDTRGLSALEFKLDEMLEEIDDELQRLRGD